jgi:hypothetical protein
MLIIGIITRLLLTGSSTGRLAHCGNVVPSLTRVPAVTALAWPAVIYIFIAIQSNILSFVTPMFLFRYNQPSPPLPVVLATATSHPAQSNESSVSFIHIHVILQWAIPPSLMSLSSPLSIFTSHCNEPSRPVQWVILLLYTYSRPTAMSHPAQSNESFLSFIRIHILLLWAIPPSPMSHASPL